MAKEIEIEYKTLLSEEDFKRLSHTYFQSDTLPFEQTNYYFDTPGFTLKSLNSGLRIRIPDQGPSELTLKTPLPQEQGLLETTDFLTMTQPELLSPTNWPHDDVFTALDSLGVPIEDLRLTAELTTHRLERKIAPGILLVLDESWYHGHHDFELEMEVADATTGATFFTNFLADHHIKKQVGPNKVARAVKANLEN